MSLTLKKQVSFTHYHLTFLAKVIFRNIAFNVNNQSFLLKEKELSCSHYADKHRQIYANNFYKKQIQVIKEGKYNAGNQLNCDKIKLR